MSALVPTNRFVAMFDVLGFKALRRELGTTELHKLFQQHTLPLMQHAAAGRSKVIDTATGRLFVPDFYEGSVEYRVISDTVILISKDDSFFSFASILTSSSNLLKYGLLGMKTPYRGAIGYGDAIIDGPHIAVGEAIEDAYAFEGRQAWSGCMLTPTCGKFVLEKQYLYNFFWGALYLADNERDEVQQKRLVERANLVTHYAVPIKLKSKCESISYTTLDAYVIDWTIGLFENAASRAFSPSEDEHAKVMERNTIEFEAWAREHNRRGGVGPLPLDVNKAGG